MPTYRYEAVDRNGNRKSGEMQADNVQELKATLKKSGFILLNSKGGKGGAKTSKKTKSSPQNKTKNNPKKNTKSKQVKKPLFAKVTVKEISIFTRQLATMISSGVTLLRSMTIISEQNENFKFKGVLESVTNDLTNGTSLSASMAKHPKQFDQLFVSMIRAGEASGSLELVLERLANSMEKAEELRGKVKGAMIYPIIVLVVAFSIVFLLLTFVVPKFTSMFQEAGMQLPGLTQVVVNISDFLKGYWWAVIIGIAGGIFGFKKYSETNKGKERLDTIVLKLPLFGSFVRKVAVGRFTRTMSTLLDSGVPILSAFDIVSGTVGNTVISNAIIVAKGSIKEGNTIAKPLADSGEFPTMVTQMVEIGEESGSISQMLSKVADFNEREVEEAVASMVAAMEPLAIVIMAVIVGFIVIALFLPMFELSDVAAG